MSHCGATERRAPIFLTALTAAFALVPLAIGGGEIGKEILAPMAVVIRFALLLSTFLDRFVAPASFPRFGQRQVIA